MKNEILIQKVCSIFTQMLFDNLKHVNVSNMQKKNILKRKNQQGANTFNSLRFFFSQGFSQDSYAWLQRFCSHSATRGLVRSATDAGDKGGFQSSSSSQRCWIELGCKNIKFLQIQIENTKKCEYIFQNVSVKLGTHCWLGCHIIWFSVILLLRETIYYI